MYDVTKNHAGIKPVCLPEGRFEETHNCRNCRYANWNDRKDDGRVYCDGGYGGYNHPENRNGCNYWKQD